MGALYFLAAIFNALAAGFNVHVKQYGLATIAALVSIICALGGVSS